MSYQCIEAPWHRVFCYPVMKSASRCVHITCMCVEAHVTGGYEYRAWLRHSSSAKASVRMSELDLISEASRMVAHFCAVR
jgi:hypothetical protein